jgi:putative nucleotidyltransferase with HDIG domain
MTEQTKRSVLSFELTRSERPGRIVFHGVRWGLLVALALLTYLLFPVARGFSVVPVGEVATSEVIAPFEFVVPKSQEEIARQTAAVEATLRPIYEIDQDAVDAALNTADVVFGALDTATTVDGMISAAKSVDVSLSEDQAEYLLADERVETFANAVKTMMRRQLPKGVPAAGFLQMEDAREIVVRRGDSESIVSRDSVYTFERLRDSRVTLHPDPTSNTGDQILVMMISRVFQPTLIPNRAETAQVRADLRASVSTVKDTVRENERIVDANQVVTPEIRERLEALNNEWIARGRTEGNVSATVGQILTNALLLALFWVLLMLFLPDTYASIRNMLAIATMFALVIIGAAANVGAAGNLRFLTESYPELIPIPYAAMLVTVLIGGRLAMVCAMVLAVLIGSQTVYGGADAVFIALVGGVAAGLSVRSIRRRNQLLVSVVVVTAAYLLAGLTIALRLEEPITFVGRTAGIGGVNAMISAALVTITLPLFESLTGVTTELTLLELSDPNRPLLRRLATETPGTYAHSLALANLSEAACNAIGANGLLARVGCYYHDIGKLKKPQYFVENQMPGVNPHDKLKPEVSASIIRNHVREGLALANESRLPQAIKDFIPEHHGTMEISYFLERARSQNGDEEINIEEFRYPGPKPRSVETAVVMLGDSVEAAVRVLEDPSEQKTKDAIDHLFRQRIEAGQLDEAPLTMTQITRVRDEFVRVFEGVRHNRIDYPSTTGGLSSDWDGSTDS